MLPCALCPRVMRCPIPLPTLPSCLAERYISSLHPCCTLLCSAVLAHYLLAEKLNAFGVVGCLLCIAGSLAIVLHAPKERPISSVLQVWDLAMQPCECTPAWAASQEVQRALTGKEGRGVASSSAGALHLHPACCPQARMPAACVTLCPAKHTRGSVEAHQRAATIPAIPPPGSIPRHTPGCRRVLALCGGSPGFHPLPYLCC